MCVPPRTYDFLTLFNLLRKFYPLAPCENLKRIANLRISSPNLSHSGPIPFSQLLHRKLKQCLVALNPNRPVLSACSWYSDTLLFLCLSQSLVLCLLAQSVGLRPERNKKLRAGGEYLVRMSNLGVLRKDQLHRRFVRSSVIFGGEIADRLFAAESNDLHACRRASRFCVF